MDKNQQSTFSVNISATLVTLKQSQGHQTNNENADPKQEYNHQKFKSSHFNNVCEKGNIKIFQSKYFNYEQEKKNLSGIFKLYLT